MTDARVWLVRHASTAWTGSRWCGRTDLPLTDAGRAEAAALAAALSTVVAAGARILTSPAARAVATARSVAAGCGIQTPIQVDARLRETDFGQVEGCTFDELADAHPALAAAILDGRTDVDWPDGERAADLAARVHAAWLAIERLATERDVIVVTHGGVARAMARVAVAADASGREREPLEPSEALVAPEPLLPPASWMTLARTRAGWTLLRTEHRAEPAAAAR